MFHRTFPELKISATLLQCTYREHGIRYKFILRGNKVIDYGIQYYYSLFRNMHDSIKATRLHDRKLVWVNEAVFTFNTFSTLAWASKYSSIEVSDADARVRTMAFIAAFSEDGGLEAWAIHPCSISTPEFVAFVELVSAKLGGAEFAIFLENLQVHKTT